jgi:2-keto-4-pentenoate hydratase/2-oxohepta-3-ene-1,7-dioic acid hydratase in catechol pathway
LRFARFVRPGGIAYGIVQEASVSVEEISTTPFLPYERTGVVHPLADIRLLAPCLPSKIVAVGLNYPQHVAERGDQTPEVPLFFFKPSTAVIGPGDAVKRPPACRQLDYEGELAVVIGSAARGVAEERWREVVLGYTCGIDATARDLQATDSQWGRAKGFDTSAPLGPWIESSLDPGDLRLVTRLNGEVRQDGRTSSMIFGVGALVAFVSSYVTLLPGDVILTGTPAGIGPMRAGDRVEVEIEGIGVLAVGVRDGVEAFPGGA